MASVKLLLIILDGCSADAFATADTPCFDALCRVEGATLLRAKAPLPTITYGNHATILTGRFAGGPGGHGIVGNLFRDPANGRILNLDDYPPDDFLEAPTLFERLQRGESRPVRCMAVAEPITRGAYNALIMMDYFRKPPQERERAAVNRALKAVHMDNPDLLAVNMLYVDGAGETFGPKSAEYRESIETADAQIHEILDAWRDTSKQEIHVLVTADHGMHAVDRKIEPGSILESAGIDGAVASSHRAAHIYLNDRAAIADARGALETSGAFTAILGAEDMSSINISHTRTGDLFVLAAPGVELQKGGLRGSHGSSRPEETEVPLLLSGSRWYSALSRTPEMAATPSLERITGLLLELFHDSGI
jgi:predicted AlkP superfamily pyrophosphatase or phosphodiesterase